MASFDSLLSRRQLLRVGAVSTAVTWCTERLQPRRA